MYVHVYTNTVGESMSNYDYVMMTSYIHPTFFYDGEYFLLVLSSILLIELGCLAVGRTVGVRLIKQTLGRQQTQGGRGYRGGCTQ